MILNLSTTKCSEGVCNQFYEKNRIINHIQKIIFQKNAHIIVLETDITKKHVKIDQEQLFTYVIFNAYIINIKKLFYFNLYDTLF